MSHKPTLAQRFAGSFALFALAFAHGWLAWIFYDAMANNRPPESFLDIGLFVWGMLVLSVVCGTAGGAAVFVALVALEWVAWAVKGKGCDRCA